MKRWLLVSIGLCFPAISLSVESQLWKKFANGNRAGLPDFSYAGYKRGETRIPDVDWPVYNVVDYGADPSPNTPGLQDLNAIKKAIKAVPVNQGGVIFFPAGAYDIGNSGSQSADNVIHFQRGHLVWRGEGRDKSILFIKKTTATANSYRPKIMVSVFGGSASDENLDTRITDITSDAKLNDFSLDVKSTKDLVVNQWVKIYMLAGENEFYDYLRPYTKERTWTTGARFSERHQTKSINANTVTFYEPILIPYIRHTQGASSTTWGLYTFEHHDMVGFEDLGFRGNWGPGDPYWPYRHHDPASREYDDSGWTALSINDVVNGWIRRCRFTNFTNSQFVRNCAFFSYLENDIDQDTYSGNDWWTLKPSRNSATPMVVGAHGQPVNFLTSGSGRVETLEHNGRDDVLPRSLYESQLELRLGHLPEWVREIRAGEKTCLTWQPPDIRMKAEKDHPWWSFPVKAIFVHQDTGTKIDLQGFWDGQRNWVLRFAAARPGIWTYTTSSADRGLSGHSGTIRVLSPTPEQINENPNYRGHIRISPNGRFFQYTDGTPFLLLADTLWAGNTARCGLGDRQDGPFFQYLADRRAKGFTAVLMQYFHGYGDYPDSPGHRNEGGKPFFDPPAERLNSKHFQALDVRMKALWDRGFVAAIPTTWWGKTKRCSFTIKDAQRISAYCAVRYGAFNTLWSLSGEYQYCFADCGWTPEQITALGDLVQQHNPYGHPLSIHPSGRTDWTAPHGCQSSRPFHHTNWLDHHWLQTGQRVERMYNIVTRTVENRALTPVKPVFCSEGFYELVSDAQGAYHARWQAWVALLSGCAGYGYGAQGMWQFYDPSDPGGQPGKGDNRTVPWRRALSFAGSSQIIHVATLLRQCDWWRLEPARELLRVDNRSCPKPSAKDITPPHCAAIGKELIIVYIPRGNQNRSLVLTRLGNHPYRARWYNPRTGQPISLAYIPSGTSKWKLPDRPSPAEEDWILVLETKSCTSIKPYSMNPSYWEYRGKPIMLIGGSDRDNILQWADDGTKLTDHLDLLRSCGGNYIRCTISSREYTSEGYRWDLLPYPFARINGKYDLTRWNEVYWHKLRTFLSETQKRGIIVQLEFWDRWNECGDSRKPNSGWYHSPWNPNNNSTMIT